MVLQPKLYESCDRGQLKADLKPDEKKMNPHSARWNVDQSHQEGNWVGGGCQKSLPSLQHVNCIYKKYLGIALFFFFFFHSHRLSARLSASAATTK